nr:MAG TPA: hypothetical protein [Caudoviricetes sp.]
MSMWINAGLDFVRVVLLLPARYPCERLFGVLQVFTACMCILSTTTAKLILGAFTGFIMALSYYIISRLAAV